MEVFSPHCFCPLKRDSESVSRVLCCMAVPVIYPGCKSPCTSIVLPSGSDGSPSDAGIRELSTPGVHGICVTTDPVGSYPTFSPLPRTQTRRLFSSALSDPHESLPVRKRVTLCCPDFPPAVPRTARQATSRFTVSVVMFCAAKVIKFV